MTHIPRNSEARKGITRLLTASVVVGAVFAVATYAMLRSPMAAALVLTGAIVGAAVETLLVIRDSRKAVARVRCSGLESDRTLGIGLYADLVSEACRRLNQYEQQTQEAVACKTRLEARVSVRRKLDRQLKAALDALDHPLLIVDSHGQLQFTNRAARDWFAAGCETPANRRSESQTLCAIDHIAALADLIEQTCARESATDRRTIQFELKHAAEAIPCRATATGLRDDDGGLLGVVVAVSDIRDEQQAKTRHAEFVSSVSHELKTPMAGIKAFTELLMEGDVADTDEQQELYGYINTQVDRLTRLVNNMLNLARIESGVMKTQRKDCELNDVLKRALDVVRPSAEEKQIHLTSELSDLYLPVHIDQDLFGQAVINLLSNAVKYTPEGGDVCLRSRMESDLAVIDVRDSGMGIPAEAVPRLFERFYRVEQNNKAAAGTGLGLSLVHEIVTELHNGVIDVQSTVNQGTCFTVTIPLGHAQPMRGKQEPILAAT